MRTSEEKVEKLNIESADKDRVYQDPKHDPVFGEISEEGPNYRNVCIVQDLHACMTSFKSNSG
jgi:hypothetical protein